MKTVFLLFDSLNRRAMECYGGSTVNTPNFKRFAERAITFDNHYVGSLPCMPARREMHSGRLNFLHRSWGPLEPFDHSFPALLRDQGVYSHLVSDHYHYFEDGGWSYHTRYSSWEFIRGQEKDHWKAMVQPPLERFQEMYHSLQTDDPGVNWRTAYMINRESIKEEKDFPSVQCFQSSLDFLETNRDADNWLLHLETFDPHEPFYAPARFREAYPTGYQGPILDWPRYQEVTQSDQEIAELRANYAALVSMCDEYFGRLLDYFDEHDMWKDTALVLTTDHGFMLAEHEWWGKNRMPFYNEISHIPLMIYHPDFADKGGERRQALTQTIDVMPTLLEMNGAPVPAEVEGRSLLPVMEQDHEVRRAALYGIFGGATNITDGRHTYFRYPPDLFNQELYEYTLMPTHQASFFTPAEFEGAELVTPFDFTKGLPVMRLPARRDAKRPPMQGGGIAEAVTVLYDLKKDPGQNSPIKDPETEARLLDEMVAIMRRNEAPPEAYRRLELNVPD